MFKYFVIRKSLVPLEIQAMLKTLNKGEPYETSSPGEQYLNIVFGPNHRLEVCYHVADLHHHRDVDMTLDALKEYIVLWLISPQVLLERLEIDYENKQCTRTLPY